MDGGVTCLLPSYFETATYLGINLETANVQVQTLPACRFFEMRLSLAGLVFKVAKENDMSSHLSKTTQDHEEIRKWAEARGGKPSHVKATGSKDDVGILRIDFPGYSGEGTLEPITWEQFFEKFDERNLALVYQEKTASGEISNFNKIISAEDADHPGHSSKHDKAEHKTEHSNSSQAKAKSASH